MKYLSDDVIKRIILFEASTKGKLLELIILTVAIIYMITVSLVAFCSKPEPTPSANITYSDSPAQDLYDCQRRLFNAESRLYSANATIEALQARIDQLESQPAPASDCKQISEAWAICQSQLQDALAVKDSAVNTAVQAEANYKIVLDKNAALWKDLDSVSAGTDNTTASGNFTATEAETIYEWWDLFYNKLEK